MSLLRCTILFIIFLKVICWTEEKNYAGLAKRLCFAHMQEINNTYARENDLICIDWTARYQKGSISAGRWRSGAMCQSNHEPGGSGSATWAPPPPRLLPPHHTSTSTSISLPSASLPPNPDTSGQGAPIVIPHRALTVTATIGTWGKKPQNWNWHVRLTRKENRWRKNIYTHTYMNLCVYMYCICAYINI